MVMIDREREAEKASVYECGSYDMIIRHSIRSLICSMTNSTFI
jgi:hypothetical protein